MRLMGIPALILAATLGGCSSQPTLNHQEIDRIHTAKVVYIRTSEVLGVFQDPNGGVMPVPLGGGQQMFIYMPDKMTGPGILTKEYLSGTYGSEMASLDVRQRLFAAATQAIPQVSWLAKAPFSVIDHTMDNDAMWHDVLDSNVDAAIYLEPIVALAISGTHLRLGIKVTVYVNPRTRNAYRYDSVLIGSDQEIRLKQDPNKPHQSISARSPEQLADIWFEDHAAQLHGDMELELTQIEPGLVHYLAGNGSTKGN